MFLFRKRPKAVRSRKVKPKKRPRKIKSSRKAAKPKKKKAAAKQEVPIGAVSHYFPRVKAGAVVIKKGTVMVGDTLHFKGHTSDFKQKVRSLQIDRMPVQKASKGAEIGVRVKARVRTNDKVYKVKT